MSMQTHLPKISSKTPKNEITPHMSNKALQKCASTNKESIKPLSSNYLLKRLGKSKSIKSMIKNMNNVRKAQIRMIMPPKHKKNSKSLNKMGTGGGFKQGWSGRNFNKLNMITPTSVQKLQNFEHMDVDKLLMRKEAMFDFQTIL